MGCRQFLAIASWRVNGLAASSSLRPVFRRTIGAWIVVAFLVSAIAFYRMSPDASTSQASDNVAPAAGAEGAGSTTPGILMVVTPRPDATLDVTETVLLDSATSSLEIRPPDFSGDGAIFSDEVPYASKVRITAGDQSVPVPEGLVNRAQTLSLDEPTRRYEMRYELNRAVVRSEPSSAGRALGAIRPLTSGVSDDLRVAVVVVGDAVLNISCPGLVLSEQACATGSPPLLRVGTELPWRTAVVVVQIDLGDQR